MNQENFKKTSEKISEIENAADVDATKKANSEIIACLDDYFVNSDDTADVEIENEINNRLAEEKKRQDFIKSVLNIYGDKKIKLIPQKNLGSAAYLTARKVEFNDFDYRKMSDGLYHIRICRDGHYYAFSTLATYEIEEQVLQVIRELGAAIWRGDETFTFPEVEEVVVPAEEKNSLKAKVAEILNRPRKSIVDWKATFEDMQISEILDLQKDLKKFLKLGQIDLAENVFSMLKTLCRNYREQVAA